jgi:hypothetical protein
MNRVRLGLIGLGERPRQAYLRVLMGLTGMDVCSIAGASGAPRCAGE